MENQIDLLCLETPEEACLSELLESSKRDLADKMVTFAYSKLIFSDHYTIKLKNMKKKYDEMSNTSKTIKHLLMIDPLENILKEDLEYFVISLVLLIIYHNYLKEARRLLNYDIMRGARREIFKRYGFNFTLYLEDLETFIIERYFLLEKRVKSAISNGVKHININNTKIPLE
ncbi:hypothetical protein TpMuguga_02g00773 [Theileria parva strain Muguga]|uniref:Uncharacterized protein n=1 Tax=Theileria parva TaxID=5875 RepID=Q4N466_THEPA|nr:uncharacterized protein TpMuguga_02g00773 [Theileria parva strain Muguga]EAN33057.1 hypothetical protein TpMuguga_02g00773 [Theileria parva strain Muguga]|eukprot:XP_765340.1 hypothetical protein [Theileria parva strain Muguga]